MIQIIWQTQIKRINFTLGFCQNSEMKTKRDCVHILKLKKLWVDLEKVHNKINFAVSN